MKTLLFRIFIVLSSISALLQLTACNNEKTYESELESLENNALAQEKLGVMCEAIAGLPNKCRQVVVMRKIYGFSTKDIAKRMNISTITVSNYITKGMCAYNDAILKYNDEQMKIEQQKKPNTLGATYEK